MRLLSALKEKKRYVFFEIVGPRKFSLAEVEKAVNDNLNFFLGQLLKAKSAPIFIREQWNGSRQQFLMKVNHKYVNELKAALLFIKKIKNTNVIVKSVLTTSTIKKIYRTLE